MEPDLIPILGAMSADPWQGDRIKATVENSYDGYCSAHFSNCFISQSHEGWADYAIPYTRVAVVELLSRSDQYSEFYLYF